MEKYAVIKTGGKQYLVQEGQMLTIDHIKTTDPKKVIFDQVLLIKDKEKLEIGTPFLTAPIEGDFIGEVRGKKIRVSKFKAKTGYRKTIGHRSLLTKVKIGSISTSVVK